jgi:hypothetical protein
MSTTFNCNFCKKSYTSQSNLNNHQKTAKFCLDLQNKLSSGELIRCEYCLKEFATKKYLQQHIEICKQKKNVEQNDLKKDLENFKNEIIELKLKLEMKDEIIKNLEKINKDLLSRPSTSIINNNNDNRQQNQYNIQYNQLFEKLPILNEVNVNNKITELSTEEKINEYHFDNFYPESVERIVNQLTDFTFSTDTSRKIVVIKDKNEKSVKMNAEEFLSICFKYGSESILNHIKLADKIVDDKIENSDPSLTSEMLDCFNDDRDKFINKLRTNKDNFFLTNNQTDNKIELSVVSNYIKHIEKCSK